MQDSRTASHCSKLPLRTPIGYESLPQVSVLALLGWLITLRKPARTPNAIVEEVQSYANDIMQYHSISRGSQIKFPSRLSNKPQSCRKCLSSAALPACLFNSLRSDSSSTYLSKRNRQPRNLAQN